MSPRHTGHRLLGNPMVTEGDMESELQGLGLLPQSLSPEAHS